MKSTITSLLVLCYFLSFGQDKNLNSPLGGGAYEFEPVECISDVERKEIKQMLKENIHYLRQVGKLPKEPSRQFVSLEWPLRQADGFDFNNYYGISNYIDHNPVYSGSNNDHVLDYYCGNRSYDTGSGYNHRGTDMFTWPFQWFMLDHDQVEVISVADGVIIGKIDGNYDRQCTFNSSSWNAVYVMHEDGSVAWYGHVKEGSLTTKVIGEEVTAGEYLAVVASSGNSTGPHLHFEFYDADDHLIDPYQGECNGLNDESWWADQQAYREPTINTITTGWNFPLFFWDCPPALPAESRIANCFPLGSTIYFAVYFKDQEEGMLGEYAIYTPDGELWTSWTHSSPTTYNASYWYWSRFVPNNSPTGEWTYEVSFAGHTVSKSFWVGDTDMTTQILPALPQVVDCEGLLLSVDTDAENILWSTGETTTSIEPTTSGNYYVTVTSADGCVAYGSRAVEILPSVLDVSISGEEVADAGELLEYRATKLPGYSYDWEVVSGILEPGEEPHIVNVVWDPNEDNQICVTATNAEGCVGEQVCLDIMVNPVSNTTSYPNIKSFHVFPNPSSESLNIISKWNVPVNELNVRLRNELGQIVWTDRRSTIQMYTQQVNVKNWASGLYFLEIQTAMQLIVEKVVIN